MSLTRVKLYIFKPNIICYNFSSYRRNTVPVTTVKRNSAENIQLKCGSSYSDVYIYDSGFPIDISPEWVVVNCLMNYGKGDC